VSGAGLTALAAGFGVAFSIQGNSLDEDAATQRSQISEVFGETACSPGSASNRACSKLNDTLDRRNRSNAIAQGSFIAAGVLGAATLATFFFWPKQSSVAPYANIDPRSGGATLGLVGQY
jgi:hypothetical protein